MRRLTLDTIADRYDLAIVGGGPAGMAAALCAGKSDLRILLIDEGAGLGGQIYRGLADMPDGRKQFLGRDYLQGEGLLHDCENSDVDYLPLTTVWSIEDGRYIALGDDQQNRVIIASRIILAPGAI